MCFPLCFMYLRIWCSEVWLYLSWWRFHAIVCFLSTTLFFFLVSILEQKLCSALATHPQHLNLLALVFVSHSVNFLFLFKFFILHINPSFLSLPFPIPRPLLIKGKASFWETTKSGLSVEAGPSPPPSCIKAEQAKKTKIF